MKAILVISYLISLLTIGFIAWFVAAHFLTDIQNHDASFAGMGLLAVVMVLLLINIMLPWRCFMCSGAIIMLEGIALTGFLIFANQEYLFISILLLVPGFILFWNGYKHRGLSLYSMIRPDKTIEH